MAAVAAMGAGRAVVGVRGPGRRRLGLVVAVVAVLSAALDRAAAACFAGALRGRSSGVTLERPAKAKLRIRL